ncbi:hypothetical protein O181_001167 [Austropuccinia psidii MF-1]|uniref:Cleavage/polyadenylation specificity factor A subunit C-terminal domain-containing protein n=1 Tax=Austropuccinia psidii MF-1 TaxID=1389203 RepID=A0A9Q3BA26_9BASI|nr:hypothetical protein [Austropuccinia psidii MF-1]
MHARDFLKEVFYVPPEKSDSESSVVGSSKSILPVGPSIALSCLPFVDLMNVLYRQHLPPSGVEFACQASLTPSTSKKSFNTTVSLRSRPKPFTNLVVARSTFLHIFEVCLISQKPASFETTKGLPKKEIYKLFHVCEHRLHGRVTGLQKVTTVESLEDGLDRLIISFQDAKITLMEWSPLLADLETISLHTFEKLPQITQRNLPLDHHALLETEPLSRCAVLLLPQGALVVLPLFQDHLDLDALGPTQAPNSATLGPDYSRFQSFPHASSFILDLNQQLTNHQNITTASSQRPIKAVISLKFLPGFSEPTLAVLYHCQYTWSARLENGVDTTALIILTLDLGSKHFPIISHTKKLPYDAHALIACPKELGGVLVLCADMILHVDQSSKVIGVATNGWAKHSSDLKIACQETVSLIRLSTNAPKLAVSPEDLEDGEEEDHTEPPDDTERLLIRLENSKIVFYKLDLAIVFLRDGLVFSLEFERDGRTLTNLKLEKFDVRSVPPSTVLKLSDRCLFVGSMTGDSALYAIDNLKSKISPESSKTEIRHENSKAPMDLDLDEDIYGEPQQSHDIPSDSNDLNSFQLYDSSQHQITQGANMPINQQKVSLRLSDAIQAYGSIRDFTMASLSSGNMSPELLACTGAGDLGGLTVFHREMPVRKRRQIQLSAKIKRLFFTATVIESTNHTDEQKRLIWVLTPENQTEVFLFKELDDPGFICVLPEITLAVSDFFEGKYIVQVTSQHIKLLTSTFQELQVIIPEPPARIKHANIVDAYVMVETTNGLILVYQGDVHSKTLSKLPFPSCSSRIKTASLLQDDLPTYSSRDEDAEELISKTDAQAANRQDNLYQSVNTLGSIKDSALDIQMEDISDANNNVFFSATDESFTLKRGISNQPCWLLTTTKDGNFHIHHLPTMVVVFTAKRIDTLPETLVDEDPGETGDSVDLLGSGEQSSGTAEPIAQIFGFLTGATIYRPHVAVILQSGAFAVYEIFASFVIPRKSSAKHGHPAIMLKKVLARQFEASQELNEPIPSQAHEMDAKHNFEQLKTSRGFTPLMMAGQFRGAFLSGEAPVWLVSTDHGPCRIYESFEGRAVYCIAQLPNSFLMCLDELSNSKNQASTDAQQELWEAWVSEYVCLDREIPSTLVKTGRPFNKVVYDPSSETIVGASYLETSFANFDEEGNLMWEPEDDSLIRSTTFRSSLELILPGSWVTFDGYEFQQNEWVTSMASMDLDSRSTIHGRRKFIGVGTTCNRAEDLAARGGVYVFEVIDVNPDEKHPAYNRSLRLRYHEETKACVTSVDSINGYFLHTMGQKLYAKCFEQDERLLAVGFLDIKPYATCLKSFKNFILLGDAAKGVTLVAFQEEPYKLIELGHTYMDMRCSTVDFVVIDMKLAIVTTDLNGTIRIFEYNPNNIESQAGQKLLCQTE